MPGEPRGLKRRALLAAGALLSLPLRAQVVDEAWTDEARARTLPLRIRWPDGVGPWPLLLFSHGLGGSREGGEVWGEAWREAGFVVVHLQHPGSDAAVWTAGPAALRAAASAEQLIARADDVRFVLDEVSRRHRGGDGRWAGVPLDAIGMSGHSFGAHTVCLVAGKRYPVDTAAWVDARPRAFIAFSPTPTPGRLTPAEQFGGVTRPFLVLTGSLDGDPFGRYRGGATRWQVFEALPAGAKAGLWLDGADHFTFAGQRGLPRRLGGLGEREAEAVAREPAHHALLARLSTQWWRSRLLGDAAALQPPALGAADRWVIG